MTTSAEAATSGIQVREAHPGASRTALLLMLCFVVAQADKQVMGLLAVPVQRAFALSDTQLGFLQGGAFAIAFAIGGLPVAQLLDGGHRLRIAAACVAVWTLATIFCGLAQSFLVLILFRAATAFAEAGLPPAAFSIFSQSGNPRIAARLTGTFMLAPYIGGGLMLLLGGWLLNLATGGGLGLLGITEGWRLVFLAVGLPGLVLAPLLLWLGHEPARPAPSAAGRRLPSYWQVVRTIFVEQRFLRFYYMALPCFYLSMAALIAWYPASLVRGLGLSPAAAGGYAGITYLVAGVAGTLSVMARAALRKGVSNHGMVGGYAIALTFLLPVSVALPLMGSLGASLTLYGCYAFLASAITASMAVPVQMKLENSMQARGVAIFSLLMSALAGSVGPLLVGVLSDRTPLGLGGALAATGLVSTAAALILLLAARRALAREEPVR